MIRLLFPKDESSAAWVGIKGVGRRGFFIPSLLLIITSPFYTVIPPPPPMANTQYKNATEIAEMLEKVGVLL